jgi:hypothetical protein
MEIRGVKTYNLTFDMAVIQPECCGPIISIKEVYMDGIAILDAIVFPSFNGKEKNIILP